MSVRNVDLALLHETVFLNHILFSMFPYLFHIHEKCDVVPKNMRGKEI